ncbi:MAG: hypothetical protein FJ271_27290 [Planctomycetes bacterium]|nr:hypothetical protein [Planctomycetota bacterium]
MSAKSRLLIAIAFVGLTLGSGTASAQPGGADVAVKGTSAASAGTPVDGVAKSKRRVYVLHSGVHTILADPWKNVAADTLKAGLVARGVTARDIVVLDNPYPTATWRNMFPKECLTMFAASSMPASKTAQDAYVRMHKSLQSQGIKPGDEIIWVGHSAGGQMGLTMAYLAKNLDKYPELAKQAASYRFDMVIMLGSPVGCNMLTEDVKLRHYYSPQDKVVRWVARYGPLFMKTFGYRVGCGIMPPSLNPEDRIRVFLGIEHPFWDVDARVLDRIIAETNPAHCPLWHSPILAPGLEMALTRIVTQAISTRYQVSFEDPPGR